MGVSNPCLKNSKGRKNQHLGTETRNYDPSFRSGLSDTLTYKIITCYFHDSAHITNLN